MKKTPITALFAFAGLSLLVGHASAGNFNRLDSNARQAPPPMKVARVADAPVAVTPPAPDTTYKLPQVTSMSPKNPKLGETVTIEGRYFNKATRVMVGKQVVVPTLKGNRVLIFVVPGGPDANAQQGKELTVKQKKALAAKKKKNRENKTKVVVNKNIRIALRTPGQADVVAGAMHYKKVKWIANKDATPEPQPEPVLDFHNRSDVKTELARHQAAMKDLNRTLIRVSMARDYQLKAKIESQIAFEKARHNNAMAALTRKYHHLTA